MSDLIDPRFFGEAFVTLFVIMDPAGTIPVFLALTSGRTPKVRRRAALQAVLVSLAVICSFAVFGQAILDYLGIGIPALQGAGGLLLLLVALQLPRRSQVSSPSPDPFSRRRPLGLAPSLGAV
jgi:multiple antibiotic resistance protein